MERTNFEKLDVYKLSEKLSDLIWDIAIDWHQLARYSVGIQLIRSTDSIGANIAEGTGRGSSKENKRFARIARGSLFETKHWLRRAVKRKLLSQKNIEQIKLVIDELSPRLSAYINAIKTTNN
ncbi:MAG: four helix bundle protein [Bacteroidetes bacterium]|nr:four helix bundle protein [Bacteroidota bacterium]